MQKHFQLDGHEPEVVISPVYGTYQDRVKSYFIASEHDKFDVKYASSVRRLVTHEMNRDFANRQ